jgi:hypothetical protein
MNATASFSDFRSDVDIGRSDDAGAGFPSFESPRRSGA